MLVDATELPTLADIQLAHLKLRALCLPGERGLGGCPVGDQVGTTPPQFQGSFSSADPPTLCPSEAGAVADEKWLSALEGTRWLDHVR